MLKTLLPHILPVRMPVDYTTYLLSSSPTASSFEILSSAFAMNDRSKFHNCNVFNFNHTQNEIENIRNELNESVDDASSLKPIISRRYSMEEEECSMSETSSGRTSPSSVNSSAESPKLKKKVSFADHKGLALATVKVMSEPSDVPPRLKPEILQSITQGATAGVTTQPPLSLNFQQPASDYLTFRERLDSNFVSLENVIIRDYNMLGTIKVKNISFEKKVFLRCTFDSWESHTDVDATYVNSASGSSEMFDTFSFEFCVPPDFDSSKKMEFAVCYTADGKQHWDNNGGKNYEIFSADFKPISEPEKPVVSPLTDISALRNVPAWSEYDTWNKVDTSLPYW